MASQKQERIEALIKRLYDVYDVLDYRPVTTQILRAIQAEGVEHAQIIRTQGTGISQRRDSHVDTLLADVIDGYTPICDSRDRLWNEWMDVRLVGDELAIIYPCDADIEERLGRLARVDREVIDMICSDMQGGVGIGELLEIFENEYFCERASKQASDVEVIADIVEREYPSLSAESALAIAKAIIGDGAPIEGLYRLEERRGGSDELYYVSRHLIDEAVQR